MNKENLSHQEVDKSIAFDGATLQGTLCMPLNTLPKQLVIMLPGSGEIDRNENAMQMQLNTFNTIAHKLADVGIASFRFDKRGCAMSDGNYHQTGFFNFVDDAEAWLNSIHSFDEVSQTKIYLMGHGEGSLIASFLSAGNEKVQGQILLTPSLENAELAVERQLQRTLDEVSLLTGIKGIVVRLFIRLSGNQLNKQRKLMKRIKNTTKSTIKLKKTLINAKWLREISSVEPASIYEKVTVPTLAIGGEKDLQSLPSDTTDVQTHVRGPVETHVLSNMTHILRVDEELASAFRYKKLAQDPIDPRVCDLVIQWLQSDRSALANA